jgi:Tol biopolymer transport system component
MVINGQFQSEYDSIPNFAQYSADSKHFAYVAKAGPGQLVVTDGKNGPAFDAIGGFPIFSLDGKHLAYAASRDGKWTMVRDGQAGPFYDAIQIDSFRFSPDGTHLAYVAAKGTDDSARRFLVMDGKEGAAFDEVDSLVFSPDSKSFLVITEEKGKRRISSNGQPGDEYDIVVSPFFSSDSKHCGCVAENQGKRFVVVDGVPDTEFEEAQIFPYTKLQFDQDNAVTYLAATKSGLLVRVRHGTQVQ